MLLTITTTAVPATDLGYLLHKHPDRVHVSELAFGKAYVFYPEATESRCTAALFVEVDPVGLVRGGPGGHDGAMEQYVNDRPYVASSFLSVALADVFRSALSGRSKERPDLATEELPLEATLSVVPCFGGESLLRRLFEPLGYVVDVSPTVLDEHHPDWGPSRYFRVRITGKKRIGDLLSHLYVLMPALDGGKHYWVGDAEVDKLVRHGEGWLAAHPERDLVARRYLKHKRSLARVALDRLLADDPQAESEAAAARTEAELEKSVSLAEQRIGAVLAVLRQSGAKRVLDLGCGDGRLLRALAEEKSFDEIVGVDVSHRALEIAADRLRLDRSSEKQRERIKLVQGSLLYRDSRLEGYDAAAVVEVVEHLDLPRLATFERILFGCVRPRVVALTTPNVEYNVRLEGLAAGSFRHRDHRFEWTRDELRAWATRVAERFSYSVRFLSVGVEDAMCGPPTQMAVFTQ